MALRDDNNLRVEFDNEKYDKLMEIDSRSKEEIKEIIFRKISALEIPGKIQSPETVSQWNKLVGGKYKGNPGRIEYVKIIAEVLGVDYEELIIYPDEKSEDYYDGGFDSEDTDETIDIGEDTVLEAYVEPEDNTDPETNIEIAEDKEIDNEEDKATYVITVDEAINAIRENRLIRYFLESILWHFFGVGIGLIEKRKILDKKIDDYGKYVDYLCELGSCLQIPPSKKVFKSGSWFEALLDKRYIRNRMKFYGMDWLYMLTCLRYICKIDISWYQILGVFYGLRVLSDETLQAFQYLFENIGMRKLQDALPVKNLDDARHFSELSDQEVFNYIANAHSVLLPETYRRKYGLKDRNKVIERYLNNYNIKIPFYSPRNAYGISMDNLSSLKILLCEVKKEEAVIFYDDTYMGDEMLKQQVEAYTYEKGISVIYCRKQ
jgi:hypothetical protein